MNRKRFVRS